MKANAFAAVLFLVGIIGCGSIISLRACNAARSVAVRMPR